MAFVSRARTFKRAAVVASDMADDECIFCQIVTGRIPGRTVYASSSTTAFLDVNPLAMGHTLVVPNDHHKHLQDLSEAAATDLWSTVHELLPAIESAVGAEATNVGVNNGEASGQEVDHVHVHVVPRFHGDGGNSIHAVGGRPPSVTDDDLDTIQEAIEGSL